MNDNMERKRKLSELLNEILVDYPAIVRKPLSQNDISILLGVDTSSFSQWATQKRLPVGDNIYALGGAMLRLPHGKREWVTRYYNILGIPQPVPPELVELVDFWMDEGTTEHQREKFIGAIDAELELLRGLDNGPKKGDQQES